MNNVSAELIKINSLNKFREYTPIILELRPHLEGQDWQNIYTQLVEDGYEMMGITIENEPVGYAGYREIFDLTHGRHLYIDELVTTEKRRSQGLGKLLLGHLETVAQNRGISYMRLCSGLSRENAHRFYEREGWAKKSYAFFKKFKD